MRSPLQTQELGAAVATGIERRRINFVGSRKMSAAGDSGYDVCPPGLVPLNDGASNGHSKPQVVQARSAGEVQARAAETAANGDGEHGAVMEIDLEGNHTVTAKVLGGSAKC